MNGLDGNYSISGPSGGSSQAAYGGTQWQDMNHTNSYGLIKGLQFGSFVFQYYCMVPWHSGAQFQAAVCQVDHPVGRHK